jgi:hypothetical protein
MLSRPWGLGGSCVALALVLGAGDASAASPLYTQQAEWAAGAGAQFGYAVAVSGNTAVVGAPNANGAGAVAVFGLSGTTWTQQATLTPSDATTGDAFGASVSLDGNTLIVGAPQRAAASGRAYVFVRSGTSWVQQAELSALDATSQFAYSVLVSGNGAFVGAFGSSAVYVFGRSGSTWSEQQRLQASDPTGADAFGASLSLGGTTLLIGAPNRASQTGAVYVFGGNGAGAWAQQAELTAPDHGPGDRFGAAVAASGNTAWIGAPGHSGRAGAAYVFASSGSSWTEQQAVPDPVGAANDLFGSSLAVASREAIVGSPGLLSRGGVYAFMQSGTAWSQQQQLTGSDTSNNDAFGSAVALQASTFIAGASARNGSTGAAYAFTAPGLNVPALGPWTPVLGALLLFAGLGVTATRRRGSRLPPLPKENLR